MVGTIDERLARQLAKKIKLENRFKPHLRRFFKQISRDVTKKWAATGQTLDLDNFQLELIAILRGHYRTVERAFSKDARKEAKTVNFILETKQEENIDTDIADYINQHSIEQSVFILQTTQKDLNRVAALATVAANISPEPITRLEMARQIGVELGERSANRIDTIAMTETQTPSEDIKFIEALAVSETLRRTTGQTMVKTWATVLDEKTRASHVLADRQERPVNSPFLVQGERLMVPGDASLGASPSNIINCRCASINTVVGEPAGFNPRERPVLL